MLTREQWIELFRGLQSTQNDVRQQAEELFAEKEKNHLNHTCTSLLAVALEATAANDTVSADTALVLLRKTLDTKMTILESSVQQTIKTMLLEALELTKNMPLRRKLALCIISVKDHNLQWPELLPFLAKLGSTSDGAEIVMFLMTDTVRNIGYPMAEEQTATVQTLLDFTKLPELNKQRVMLMLALVSEAQELHPHMKKLIPYSLQFIKQCSTKDWEEISPFMPDAVLTDFFVEHIPQVLDALISTRSAVALYSIGALVEGKLNPEYVQPIVDFIFVFLAAYDDDLAEWAACDDSEPDEEDVKKAKECLDRISKETEGDVGVGAVLPAVFRKVETLLRSSNWKEQISCIGAVGIIAEYMTEEAMLSGSVQIGLAFITHENPRLRHGAWTLLAQLAKEHGPELRTEENIRKLLEAYANSHRERIDRVNVRCLMSYMYVGAGLDRDEALEWAPQLMQAFGPKLAFENTRKASLGAIGMLCTSLDDDAAPYYGDLMPRLKEMMSALVHEDEETLGEVLDCQSRLGHAVGKERYTPDAIEIMTSAAAALGSSNEVLKQNAMIAVQRTCEVLAPDVFAQFLPSIVPTLFLNMKDKVKEVSKSDAQAEMVKTMLDESSGEAHFELSCTMDAAGNPQLCFIKTSALEDLHAAIDCIHSIIIKAGNHFGPYFQQTAIEMIPLVEFPLSDEVRTIACMVWGELIKMARLHDSKVLSEMVLKFIDGILGKWNAKTEYTDVQVVEAQAGGVVECIRNAGAGVLNAEHVHVIGKSALTHIRESLERDTTEEMMEEEVDAEKSLRQNFSDVLGTLMEHYLDDFNTHLLQSYTQLIQFCFTQSGEKTKDIRLLGLYMVADIFKRLPINQEIWNFLIPLMVQDISVGTTDDIIQNSSYNLGEASLKVEFAPYAKETAKRCAAVICDRRSKKKLKDEQVQLGVDNCLFALGNIMVTHLEAADGDLWQCWVRHLPCREDLDEGPIVHALLIKLVKSQHPGVTQNWTEILRIFAEIYKTEMADDVTNNAIRDLVSMAGQEHLAKYAGNLPLKKQKKLLRLWNEVKGC